MFKIETSDPLNKMLTIGSVSLTPISSQQGNGIVKSYGKTIMLSPVNINNINSQEDYGFSSNLPLGDYVMNVIMKYDDKPVSGLYETRLQIIQPILTENNEKVIKKEQHDTTKNIYHIVKYAGKTNISLNNVNKNNDPLKEARDYYQKLFGHVPSERLLKNLVAYYKDTFGIEFGKEGSRGIDMKAGFNVNNCSDQKGSSGIISECENADKEILKKLAAEDPKFKDPIIPVEPPGGPPPEPPDHQPGPPPARTTTRRTTTRRIATRTDPPLCKAPNTPDNCTEPDPPLCKAPMIHQNNVNQIGS